MVGDDRLQIPELLRRWGYPRDLAPGELTVSYWFAYGDDVLFWYNSDAGHPELSSMLHVCVAAEARGRALDRWGLVAVEVLAVLYGLTLLYTQPPTDGVSRVLRSFGWVPSDLGEGVLERHLPKSQRSPWNDESRIA